MISRNTGWRECLLGDVLTLKRGYDLPQSQRQDGSFPVVTSSGISGFHNTAKVKGPGVVTGRYGTLGEVYYIEQDYWPHNTSLYVRDFKGNHPKFISYFLRGLNLNAQNAAAAVPGVNRNFLHLIKVRVPQPPVQQQIAAVLSAYDDLIENNTLRIQVLERMAQTTYREWFVNFRFPGHAKVKLIASPLGSTPQGWNVVSVPKAIELNPRTTVSRDGQKPFVPMTSLSTGSMLISDTEAREGNSGSKFKNGDTLFARITPCLENGKTGFVQFLPLDDAVAFGSTEFMVLRSKTVTPEYVYCLARSDEFRGCAIKSMSGATGRQRVQEACFEKFLLAQPPEQVLATFTEAVRPMFKLVHFLAQKNENLRRTRDLLLPRLLAGQVDVSNLPDE